MLVYVSFYVNGKRRRIRCPLRHSIGLRLACLGEIRPKAAHPVAKLYSVLSPARKGAVKHYVVEYEGQFHAVGAAKSAVKHGSP